MDRRLIRIALGSLPALGLLALLFAALYLAGDAQNADSRLGRWSPWLFGGALAVVLLLLVTIVRQFWQLLRERRARAPGARLATRLTLALVLLAVPPVVLVYGFALKFLNSTIDSWFDVRIERALDDALELGRLYLADEIQRAGAATDPVAASVQGVGRAAWQSELDQALDRSGALQLALFGTNGAVLASAAADPRLLLPTPPDATLMLRVRDAGGDAFSEPLGDDLVVRVLRTIDADTVLQGIYGLPARAQPLTRSIETSYHDYQRLAFLRNSLKLTFTLILSAVLLLSVLLAVLAALAVARRQVAPVARLAAATGEIAAGRYGHQLPAAGDDELGFLTESFNRMTRELDQASTRARDSQLETERQRAYLETVLERLSSGVLTVDAQGRLRTANRAAGGILGLDLSTQLQAPLQDLAAIAPALTPLADLLIARSREGAREWREELRLIREDGNQVLMLRSAQLPDASYVVVFDDQTVLNQAQREAAWGEVARRLAHEVKNPLTPIQLAAERLTHRLASKLEPDDAAVLDKATRTIVAQVEALKTLVNAFGDYARPPQLQLQPLKLNSLVAEVLDLYEHGQRLKLTRTLDPAAPGVRADAGRMRQLLHNLIKNALEASGADPEIDVVTRCTERAGAREVELSIADRGAGLPAGFDESWFEPYRTSKAKGTGLGLAIVRKVAEEHGGQVRAEAREGGGARFVVILPRL